MNYKIKILMNFPYYVSRLVFFGARLSLKKLIRLIRVKYLELRIKHLKYNVWEYHKKLLIEILEDELKNIKNEKL